MAPSTYRFLPWTRRGLVDRIPDPDTGGALPTRAKLAVGLTLTGSAEARYDLSLHGPGDVIGIDTRLIVRTDPRPNATDFEANFFPVIDFDPPDFPWLFTPAATGAGDRLRPWCVLIVVDLSVVDAPSAESGQPLPVLFVPDAARATELPDLSESWAWAHTQIVTSSSNVVLATALASEPTMNVSRLMAPRRLEAGKRYAACLVPAFDAGVTRGLHGTPPTTASLGPAWSAASGDVRLPVYYHWEFATGPAGDFETLARRLKPAAVPATAGVERMYIGNAGPELPATPATDPASHLEMDGALRSPTRASGTLADVPATVQTALRNVLDASATHAQSGATSSTNVLGPPLYGQWHARQHTVPATTPAWLRELNLDPRARAAAGLGAEIERQNQEEFMQWSWEQVGRILEANKTLSQARLSMETLARVHTRHVASLPPDRALQMAAPLHSRAPQQAMTLRATIERSSLPNAAGDPALRRLTSAQNRTMRLVDRATTGGAPAPRIMSQLATGQLAVDPTQFIPSGVVGIVESLTYFDELGLFAPQMVLDPVGLSTMIEMDFYAQLQALTRTAVNAPAPGIPVRGNIGTTGIVPEARVASALATVPGGTESQVTLTQTLAAIVNTQGVRDPATVDRLTQSIGALVSNSIVGTVRPAPRFVPFSMATARDTLIARMNPRLTVPARLATKLMVGGAPAATAATATVATAMPITVAPTLDRVMAAPELDVPVYTYLARLDPKRFLPGVGDIPDDSIMLLETNPRFIEALLVGLNQEMNRELLWREFPADQRGTPFTRFWAWSDGGADIAPIHTWSPSNPLGANTRSGAGGQIAVLIRGRLFQRYPNTSVYAWRARAGKLINPPGAADIRRPVFTGVLGKDMAFAGFDLTDADLSQGDGWFIVLQEQPTEPRFGFDEGTGVAPSPITSWSNATWDHAGSAPGRYLQIAGNRLAGELHGYGRFADNAAHLAYITVQKPMCVAVHAKSMVQAPTR